MFRKLWLMTVLAGTYGFIQAQNLAFPVAHYPLETTEYFKDVPYATFTELRVWDVSGSGRHGHVVHGDEEYNAKLPDSSFIPKVFIPNGRTFFSKKDVANDDYISIPDPYDSYRPNGGFSVAFWVHWDDEDVSRDEEDDLITTKYFVIDKKGAQLRFETYLDGFFQAAHTFYTLGNPGWYFCAVVFDPTIDELRFYKYRYEEPYEAAQAKLVSPGADEIPADYLVDFHIGATIGRGRFTTGICHVQFYDKALSSSEMNARRNDIVDLEKKIYTQTEYPISGAYMHYPFDGDFVESVRGTIATRDGNVYVVNDRFSAAGKALNFEDQSVLNLPNIFAEYPENQQGYTISCWIRSVQNPASSRDGTTPPFTDTDIRRVIYSGRDADGTVLTGLQRVRDRLGALRYTYDRDDVIHPFYLWWYDPASNSKAEWVHVVLVQHANWQRAYVVSKSDQINCDCNPGDLDCINACPVSYTYQGTQDLHAVRKWEIGSKVGGSSENNIDEFRVYTYPMSAFEVRALHEIESGRADGSSARTSAPAEEIIVTEELDPDEHFVLYPNPATRELNIALAVDPQGPVEVIVTELTGIVLLRRQAVVDPQTRTLSIKDLREYARPAGVYIVTVNSPNFTGSKKVVLH